MKKQKGYKVYGIRYTALLYFLLPLYLIPYTSLSQNIAINTTGALPDSSAALDIDFPDKGLLIPRVALTATSSNTPIGAVIVTSLLVYNTATVNDVTPGYYYWNGTAWVRLLNIGSSAGTTDYLARWTSSTDLGIGITRDNGTYVGIGSAPNSNYRLFVTSANGSYDGIYGEHTSGAAGSVFNAVSGKIVNGAYTTAQGYLAYHVSNNNTYAVYGKGGNWAGYFDNKVVIGNSTPGTINTSDLEVQNTTAGSGNAATITLRQTTSNATSGNLLSNINFGDNYQANPQAQIKVIRGAASSGVTDLPTDMLFYTIDDDTTILSERLRIRYNGNVGIGTTIPTEPLEVTGIMYTNLPIAGITGIIVDSDGLKRVGLLKYSGKEAGIWRQGAQDFEIGRVISGTLTAPDPGSHVTDVYIDATGKVGIGTTGPNSKFQVEGGAIYTSTAGEGLILKSPDGLTCRKVTIDNSGVLTLTPVACP